MTTTAAMISEHVLIQQGTSQPSASNPLHISVLFNSLLSPQAVQKVSLSVYTVPSSAHTGPSLTSLSFRSL